MAPQFIFPHTLQSLEQEDSDDSNFTHLTVQNPVNLSSLRPSHLEEFVKGVSFDLSDKELFCIEEQEVFDRVYSLVKGFDTLTPGCKINFVETLRSNFSVLLPNVDSLSRASCNGDVDGGDGDEDEGNSIVDRVASHRNAFKIYTFFLVHVVLIEEASSSSNANNASKV